MTRNCNPLPYYGLRLPLLCSLWRKTYIYRRVPSALVSCFEITIRIELRHSYRILSKMSDLTYYNYKGWGEKAQGSFSYSQAVRVGDTIQCSGQGMYLLAPVSL